MLAAFISKQEPLSSIVVSNPAPELARRMLIAVAPECLATFVKAFWMIRNTASCTADGRSIMCDLFSVRLERCYVLSGNLPPSSSATPRP